MPTFNNTENTNIQNKKINLMLNKNNLIRNQFSFTDAKHKLRNLIELLNKKNKVEIENTSFWVVDRFEENLAICENRKTKEIRKINLQELPQNLKEGNVLKMQNNKYELDLEEQEKISRRIAEKMKNIWSD